MRININNNYITLHTNVIYLFNIIINNNIIMFAVITH